MQNSTNKTILQKCQQLVLFYVDSDEKKERDSEMQKNRKVEAITTYKQQKGLVFVLFEADKFILFNGGYFKVIDEVDSNFGYLKIASAKILLYLEFIIKKKYYRECQKYYYVKINQIKLIKINILER